MMAIDDDYDDEVEDSSADDVSESPNKNSDPKELVDRMVPESVRSKYEVISYRNAAVILAEARRSEAACSKSG